MLFVSAPRANCTHGTEQSDRDIFYRTVHTWLWVSAAATSLPAGPLRHRRVQGAGPSALGIRPK
eukprot:7195180-Pyramimonas_sp.AAC.1